MPMPLIGWTIGRTVLVSIARRLGLGAVIRGLTRSRFGRWVAGAAGFLFYGAISWIYDNFLSSTNMWSTVQTATYAIANFDWNQSDQSIKDQINENNRQIAQLLGRFAGSGLVRLTAVGAAYGAKLLYPVVAGRIAVALAEDTSGQLRTDFVSMIEGMRSLVLENALNTMILTFRSRRWFGMEPRAEGTPSYTFASEVTRRVEQIRHPLLRSFVEGLLGGAEDAFWDVGYIIAGTVDDMVAANRYSQAQQFGPERAIVVTPDTANPNEKITLSGDQHTVEQNLDNLLATHKLVRNRDVGQIYGMPTQTYQEEVAFKPQIRLMFRQDRAAIPEGSTPIESEITFRLMGETNATITPTKARAIAAKIRAEFAARDGYIWSKGRLQIRYFDPDLGYRLRILAISEQEGIEVINKILDIQDHTFDRSKLNVSTPGRASVNTQTGSQVVYGQARPNRRYRPTGRVRFQFAALQVHGLDRDVMLVDRTGRYIDAIERVM